MDPRVAKLSADRQAILKAAEERQTDLKALSLALGKNVSYLHAFIWKGSPKKLDGDDRKRLADLLELSEGQLKPGTASGKVPTSATVERIRGVEYARLPAFDIRAAAGLGIAVEDSDPVGWRIFDLGALRSVTKAKLPDLMVISFVGDSMLTTISNGDQGLVDTSQRTLAREGIFVLRLDGELIVKRIQKSLQDGSVTVRSDNPLYAPEVITDPDRLDVVGRVVWLARSIG